MTVEVKVRSNWTQTGGSDISKAIGTTCILNEDVSEKPQIDDVLGEDRGILLARPLGHLEHCEVQMQIFPRFKVAAATIICSASKIEVFLGPLKEYLQTKYGEIVEDGSNSGDDAIPTSYRYDVVIEKSGVANFSLKFFSQCNELCIFGTLLQVAPNPNGITTLLPKTINAENVQEMCKGSPNAEKCKLFMEIKKGMLPKSADPNLFADAIFQSTTESNITPESDATALVDSLKTFIDAKFAEMQNIFISKLQAFEIRQTAKLDNIVEALKNKQN